MGQMIISTVVAGDSHFFLNGKYTEPSSTPYSAPSSKSSALMRCPSHVSQVLTASCQDGGCRLPGFGILCLMFCVG